MKKKPNLSIAEWIIYSLFGLLSLWGLVYICLGFACNFAPFDCDLVKTNKMLMSTTNGMGFLEQGILILACGLLVIIVTLLVCSKKSDREFEKSQRRAARMSQRNNPVVDAEVSEVSSEK